MSTSARLPALLCVLGLGASGQTITVDGTNSPYLIDTDTTVDQMTVQAGGRVVLKGALKVLGDMAVKATGTVQLDPSVMTLKLTVSGTLTIDAGGLIHADAGGLKGAPAAGFGPLGATLDPVTGAIILGAYGGSGGSHGGRGGNYRNGITGTFDSPTEPVSPGGGGGCYGGGVGGRGGGVVRLVAGALVLNGALRSLGEGGPGTADASGGGAGGTLNLTVGALSGGGSLSAAGGAVGPAGGGGGGGGRIKVSYSNSTFVGTISVSGGGGSNPGEAGTIHLYDTTADQLRVVSPYVLNGGESFRSIRIEPGGALEVKGRVTVQSAVDVAQGGSLTLSSATALDALVVGSVQGTLVVNADLTNKGDLLVTGTAVVNHSFTVPNLTVATGALVTHEAAVTTMHLKVAGTLDLAQGALMSATGKGYSGSTAGPGYYGTTIDPFSGLTTLGSGPSNGGSHAGLGGRAAPGNALAAVYDNSNAPLFAGGAGGGTNCNGGTPIAGGSGGGLIRVTAGTVVVNGFINANGETPPACGGFFAAGGAGGSVVILADLLSGTGGIAARGGAGADPMAASGGGGGLILLTAAQSTFSGIRSVAGAGSMYPGGAGVVTEVQAARAPKILSSATLTTVVGRLWTYDARATGSTPLVWALVNAPLGAAINADAGQVTWTPGDAGPASFTISATNAHGSDSQTFTVTAVAQPSITSQPSLSALRGSTYHYDADDTAEATGTGPLTWSASIAPPGFSVAQSGLIQWTPTSLGSFAVCLEAANSVGKATQCFSILVTAEAGDAGSATAPHFTSAPDTAAFCGAPYRYSGTGRPDVSGTGPFAFSIESLPGTTLPDGLSVDGTTGEFSWTPSREQTGVYPLKLVVKSPSGSDSQVFSIVVGCRDEGKTMIGCGCGATSAEIPFALLALLGAIRRGRFGRRCVQ